MLTALALAATTLSACSPSTDPTPEPTAAFASEEEAFAAAEEVYRAYNDASNGQAKTSDFLTGSALRSDLETKRYLKENDLTLRGDSEIVSFSGVEARLESIAEIQAQVCLDVSDSRLLNTDGADITPADREDRWRLNVTITGSADALTISTSSVAEEASC